MARLEPAGWKRRDVGMTLNGAIALPDDAGPFSPTRSVDSALGFSPRPAGHSCRYLTYGGSGFSLGTLDAATGSVDRIPVPLPRLPTYAEAADYVAFTQSPVVSAAVLGESQLWVGTEAGSLHVFELKQEPQLQLSTHAFTSLDSSVLFIFPSYTILAESQTQASFVSGRRLDIVMGSSSGIVTIITGEMNSKGGLQDPSTALQRARKVVDLEDKMEEEEEEEEDVVVEGIEERDGEGREVVPGEVKEENKGKEEEGRESVKCITAVSTSGEDTVWCGYGKKIVILRRSNWMEVCRWDGCPRGERDRWDMAQVVKLVSSEQGVWSALSYSSSVTLWDPDSLQRKLHITCCSHCSVELPAVDILQVTTLHVSYPHLFVGTNKGDLIVFRTQNTTSVQSQSHLAPLAPTMPPRSPNPAPSMTPTPPSSGPGYRVVAAEHCGMYPVRNIFTTPLRIDDDCRSPFHSVTTPTFVQVVVACGPSEGTATNTTTPQSQILLYELVTSSLSPLATPTYLLSSMLSPAPQQQRSVSVSSYHSTSSSSSSLLSLRRRSNGGRVLPKLTFHSVSPSSRTLLALRSN